MDLNLLERHVNKLHRFSSGGKHDEKHKHLWIKGASLILDQFDNLIKKIDQNYNLKTIDILQFTNENSSKLFDIFNKHKTDKSQLEYHHVYSFILNELNINNNLNILEIGLGTNNPNLISTMGINGKPGASLKAFKEFLPNSNIYGADIDETILFNEERIRTCKVDQLDIKSFNNLSIFKKKYDLVIDDGLHSIGASFNTLLWALDNININGWIVIEDIHKIENWYSINYILCLNKNFKINIIKGPKSYIFCVKRLK